MKKILACFFIFILCFFAVSCSSKNDIYKKNNTELSYNNDSMIRTQKSTKTTKLISEYAKSSKDKSDEGGADILPRKYRNNYYQIPTFFAQIIDSEAYSAWENAYYSQNYADDTNVMVMVSYIKEFGISRKDFEYANLEYAKFIQETYSHICLAPKDYADQEMQEIYNADIIYTFDNEIINEYYLGIDYPFLNEYQYIDAVEAGTYETKTTQFITVEQMEAEIIAKYGEAEIVTTIAAEEIPTEETTVEEPAEAVTDIPETTVSET